MVRRFSILVAIMALILGSVSGCEGLRQAIRSKDSGVAPKLDPDVSKSSDAVETEPTKIQAVDADAKHPKNFFQNNRSAGGWSSEAREIEGHLGVGP